jgi:hypothetical protein
VEVAEESPSAECEEGDLNPEIRAKISRVFRLATAKNRHLPPPTVSGGHS